MQATLSHYRVLEEIGTGGMGVVYRAHDERLERDVALKVLTPGALADESARKRFRKEALALSKLNHPNIATIFDFDTQDGTDFLVEELIEGLSLDEMMASGPLPEKEIINLGVQLCEGLVAAHEQDIIHCDLKSANIRVTPDARLKILDFGLAKVLHTAALATSTGVTASMSETQTVSGTLPYMAPEQLLNEKLDARADIWAAGCVLYEMAAGRRPFLGSGPALIDAILHQQPAAVSKLSHKLSPGLEAIILKCLEKEPGFRHQTVKELRVDLLRLQARPGVSPVAARRRTSRRRIRSLAVLPLANLSRDPSDEFFSDGMTEELITDLAKIGAIKVISRTSAMRYKGSTRPLREIAAELNVDAIVEGSVVRAGEQLRITAQLIHAGSDEHLWAESYQREMRDVLSLQSEVARSIAEQIQVKLTPQERTRLAAARRVDPAAYELFLQGLHQYHTMTRPGFMAAVDCFERAIAADPTFAKAHAWLAHALAFVGYWSAAPEEQVYPKAKAAALRAIGLDDSCSVAYSALSTALWFHDWDPEAGFRAIQRAVELNPGDSTAHLWQAVFLAVWKEDRAGALREIRRAQELDPFAPPISVALGWIYIWTDDYDAAVAHCRKMLEITPQFPAFHAILGRAQDAKGDYQGAVASLERAAELEGSPLNLAWLGAAYALAGQPERALGVIAELEQLSRREVVLPLCFAYVYTGLCRNDEAFEWLERAFQARNSQLYLLKVVPSNDALRADPRYWDLVRRLGLPRGAK